MKRINVAILFVALLLFTGCINQPKVPKYNIVPSDKVGYIIESSAEVSHGHMGTTIFTNFEKNCPVNWHLENVIDEQLHNNVKREFINLKDKGIALSDITDMIMAEDGKWVLKNENIYKKLREELGLKAILVIQQRETYIETGRDPIVMSKSGIASHNFLGLKRYYAVSAYSTKLYLLKPIAVIPQKFVAKTNIIYDNVLTSFQEKSGFTKPMDNENITANELLSVKDDVVKILDKMTSNLDSLLAN